MTSRRGFSRHPLVQLTLVRFREFIREPEAVFWIFLFPILLAAGLGLAFRSTPQQTIKIGVAAGTGDHLGLPAALKGASELIVTEMDEAKGMTALRNGDIALLALAPTPSNVEVRYDDTRPDARTARSLAIDALQRSSGRKDPVQVSDVVVRERGSRYIDFVIPGLLGMNLMGSGIWGIGFGIVDARKRKLLKRLIATPMSKAQYLASYMIHRLLLLAVEVATIVGFGYWVFDMPLRGSLWQLIAICLIGSLSFGGLGLLVASRVRTMEGASGLMNLVMLPMWILSGVFFSSANFPDSMQPFIKALPLTAVNDALRANMLQGASLTALGLPLLVLAIWLVVCFALALRLFRWQ